MLRKKVSIYDNLFWRLSQIHALKGHQVAVDEFCQIINQTDLGVISQKQRIVLIDTAIKTGILQLVETLAERLDSLGLEDDIVTPKKDHYEYAYRPSFWLAAVTTRQTYVPQDAYEKIEKYLCDKFHIPERVDIDGKLLSKQEYCKAIDVWKHHKNIRLFNMGATKPRYRRHMLLGEIEKCAKSDDDRRDAKSKSRNVAMSPRR